VLLLLLMMPHFLKSSRDEKDSWVWVEKAASFRAILIHSALDFVIFDKSHSGKPAQFVYFIFIDSPPTPDQCEGSKPNVRKPPMPAAPDSFLISFYGARFAGI
jgi:hypothetical protein